MSDAVRVRFAPSPTGKLHVGGARSALFNWALARQAHGRFVLRIEDTDAERNRPEWVHGIISALAAIGIGRDDPAFEGPYFQSDSTGLHREASLGLFAKGTAYYCDCTREDLVRRTGSPQRGLTGTAGTVACAVRRAGHCGSAPPTSAVPSWTTWCGGAPSSPTTPLRTSSSPAATARRCSCWPMRWMTSARA